MWNEHFNVGDYVQINDGKIGRILSYYYNFCLSDYEYGVSCSPFSYRSSQLRRLSIGEIRRYKRKHIEFNFKL